MRSDRKAEKSARGGLADGSCREPSKFDEAEVVRGDVANVGGGLKIWMWKGNKRSRKERRIKQSKGVKTMTR